MRRARAFVLGVWEFVVGDDWRTALGVVVSLGAVAALSAVGVAAWWLMPPVVFLLLALSLRRAVGS
ncbi:MAG: hypothetical protein ACTHM1_12975 [Solirubrobacteraceae bacterium]